MPEESTAPTPSAPTRGSSTRCTSSTSPTRRRSARAGRTSSPTTGPGDAAHDRPPRPDGAAPRPAGAGGGRRSGPARTPAPARRRPSRRPPPKPAAASRRPPGQGARRRAHPRRRGPHRRQHGGQPASRRPPASARCRPSCSRSTARSSTATWAAPRAGKVSFTHLIGYAVVRAIADDVPVMNSTLRRGPDGKPRVVRHEHVGLGLAVDVEKADGSRTLLVPVHQGRRHARLPRLLAGLRGAHPQGPHQQARRPTTSPASRSASPTPARSAPCSRCPASCPARASSSASARLDYPAEFAGRRPGPLADLGVSKVITLSSTYDHRIIQGAESGLFLKRVHELLLGEDDFYDDVFRSLGVPYEAVQWRRDVNPVDREQAMLEKQMQVRPLINMHRVRGHLIADLDPLAAEGAAHAPRARPGHLRPHHLGPRPRVPHRRRSAATRRGMPLGDILARPARRLLPHASASSTCTSRSPSEKRWIQEHVEGVDAELTADEQRHILERLNAAEALRAVPRHASTSARSASASTAPSPPSRSSTPSSSAAADDGLDGAVHGHGPPRPAQRARQHRRQVLRPALQGVRGQRRPRVHPGLGRREVPPRPDRQVRQPHRQRASPSSWRPTRRTSRPSTRSSRAWPGPSMDLIDAARALPGAAVLHPRRRRLRRPGRGGRDAQPVEHQGLPGRRHRPPDHQQPARLHHAARVGPLVGVPHRRRQDGRRRRSST